VLGVRCDDPNAAAKAAEDSKNAAMGVKEVIKPSANTCDNNMDAMESDQTIVTCLEDCPEDENKIKRLGEGFTMQSPVCIAAKIN